MGCPCSPVVDATNCRVTQPRLKTLSILSQIMQQSGQLSFGRETEWDCKFLRQFRDIAEVLGKRLPVVLIRVAFPIRQCRRVRVIFHPVVSFNRRSGTGYFYSLSGLATRTF